MTIKLLALIAVLLIPLLSIAALHILHRLVMRACIWSEALADAHQPPSIVHKTTTTSQLIRRSQLHAEEEKNLGSGSH